ncbi:unnamed protein product, partial [Prunus brigantina]
MYPINFKWNISFTLGCTEVDVNNMSKSLMMMNGWWGMCCNTLEITPYEWLQSANARQIIDPDKLNASGKINNLIRINSSLPFLKCDLESVKHTVPKPIHHQFFTHIVNIIQLFLQQPKPKNTSMRNPCGNSKNVTSHQLPHHYPY